VRLHRKRDVFERREARSTEVIWNEPREAEAGARVDWQRRDVAAVEQDAAALRRDESGNLVDQRGLAGAVGADSRHAARPAARRA